MTFYGPNAIPESACVRCCSVAVRYGWMGGEINPVEALRWRDDPGWRVQGRTHVAGSVTDCRWKNYTV